MGAGRSEASYIQRVHFLDFRRSLRGLNIVLSVCTGRLLVDTDRLFTMTAIIVMYK
jgi:hypothetical protein